MTLSSSEQRRLANAERLVDEYCDQIEKLIRTLTEERTATEHLRQRIQELVAENEALKLDPIR